MTPKELKAVMKEIGCNSTETAAFLGIPKTTMQRYVDGSARIPADHAAKLTAQRNHDRSWMKSLKKKIESDLDRRFPFGIISEVGEFE